MKSQVLLTVWGHISCEAAGEFWHWSLSGVKGLNNKNWISSHYIWSKELKYNSHDWYNECCSSFEVDLVGKWLVDVFELSVQYVVSNIDHVVGTERGQ